MVCQSNQPRPRARNRPHTPCEKGGLKVETPCHRSRNWVRNFPRGFSRVEWRVRYAGATATFALVRWGLERVWRSLIAADVASTLERLRLEQLSTQALPPELLLLTACQQTSAHNRAWCGLAIASCSGWLHGLSMLVGFVVLLMSGFSRLSLRARLLASSGMCSTRCTIPGFHPALLVAYYAYRSRDIDCEATSVVAGPSCSYSHASLQYCHVHLAVAGCFSLF